MGQDRVDGVGTHGQRIKAQPRIKVTLGWSMVTAVSNGRPRQPNFATRSDQTNTGETTIGSVANDQFTGSGRPDIANPRACSEAVLLLDITETSVTCRPSIPRCDRNWIRNGAIRLGFREGLVPRGGLLRVFRL